MFDWNITERWLPRKALLDAWLAPAIVLLVGIGAFGLGRLSAAPTQESLKIYAPKETSQSQRTLAEPAATAAKAPAAAVPHNIVASKNGTKYYLPTCAGVKKILEANRVWFATVAQAQSAGYTAAAACAGL